MKILAIGANGVIGQATVGLLQQEHDAIAVGHSKGALTVDIESTKSIHNLFKQVGTVDAIISMAGNGEMGDLKLCLNPIFSMYYIIKSWDKLTLYVLV